MRDENDAQPQVIVGARDVRPQAWRAIARENQQPGDDDEAKRKRRDQQQYQGEQRSLDVQHAREPLRPEGEERPRRILQWPDEDRLILAPVLRRHEAEPAGQDGRAEIAVAVGLGEEVFKSDPLVVGVIHHLAVLIDDGAVLAAQPRGVMDPAGEGPAAAEAKTALDL